MILADFQPDLFIATHWELQLFFFVFVFIAPFSFFSSLADSNDIWN